MHKDSGAGTDPYFLPPVNLPFDITDTNMTAKDCQEELNKALQKATKDVKYATPVSFQII